MEQLKTNWESIGLSNDFLFGKIMRKPAPLQAYAGDHPGR